MWSIHARLLLVASLVLVAFLGLGALALDSAFQESMERGTRERLQGHIYALLGAAEEDAQGRMRFPEELPDPRFSTPDSGLYARVNGETGGYFWSSASLVGRQMAFLQPTDPGSAGFSRQELDGEEVYILNFGVLWEDDDGRDLGYTLAVAEGTEGMMSQVEGFRARLLYWLGGVALLLLIAQGVVLGWGLRPLRRVAGDLRRVEAGEISALGGRYPEELQGLVSNLNALIRSGRASRDRYRNSLGDLAHSLKTPLTLLQGAMETEDCDQLRQTVGQQVPRMDEIVRYQLRRAATSGVAEPGMSVPVRPVVQRLAATLGKVYRDKGIECQIAVDESVRFFGDEGDLMEFLGNLMENGFKYGRHSVWVKADSQSPGIGGHPPLAIDIEDDGPGIPYDMRNEVLNRGARIDQQLPGQGIGLSVASEIVGLYQGYLQIGESKRGGVAIHLRFPGG